MKNEFLLPADEAGRGEMHRAIEAEYGLLPVQRIGKSLMGRDINAYFIGNGGRRVAFFGAHHALEHITCNLLFAFMQDILAKNKSGETEASTLLAHFTYVIVPMVNPDGTELALHGLQSDSPLYLRQLRMSGGDVKGWQSNARGVDLNHNYNHRFSEYKAKEEELGIEAGATQFSGSYPESEPEARAVAALLRSLAPDGVVSLHSQGEEIYYQPRSPLGERLAKRAREFTGYKVAIPSGTASYGGLCDYSGESLGIPSLTLEVGKGENPLPASAIPEIYDRVRRFLFSFPKLL